MAGDAAAVLDAAGKHAAHRGRNLHGGMIGQEFAAAYPDRTPLLHLDHVQHRQSQPAPADSGGDGGR